MLESDNAFWRGSKGEHVTGVLQEVTSPDITSEHVKRRVQNWIERIDALYDQVEGWLPEDWRAQRSRTARMDEQMMREFGVSPKILDTLELSSDANRSAKIEPRGLWIIGANGRLDLTTRADHYIIVDAAENFAAPNWQIARLAERRRLEPFNARKLRSLLSE